MVGIESGIDGSIIYRGVLISGLEKMYTEAGDWNRGVPLYTEESSIQGVGIISGY